MTLRGVEGGGVEMAQPKKFHIFTYVFKSVKGVKPRQKMQNLMLSKIAFAQVK